MQFRTLTVQLLRRRVLSLTHRDSYTYGQVLASPAPTGTSFALANARKFPDKNFEGKVAFSLAGTGAGQSGYVEESASGTGVITVTPALATTFDTSTLVEILPDDITPESFMENVNTALEGIVDAVNIYEEIADPVIFDAERRQITIPAEFVKLHRIKYLDSGGVWRVFRPVHNPELLGQEQGLDFAVHGRTVYLSQALPSDIGVGNLIISGYRMPDVVDSDTDVVEAPSAYMTFKVAALLEQGQIASGENDPDAHTTRGSTWATQSEIERQKGSFGTNYLPGTVALGT